LKKITHFKYKIVLIFITMLIGQTIVAQIVNQNNPYSFFGIGELHNSNLAIQRSMGQTSLAFRSPVHINPNNPASYTALKLTAFETALDFNGFRLNTDDQTGRTSQVGLSYLNLAFPINKFLGASVGARPYSKINYFLTEERNNNEDVGTENLTYFGKGGIQQVNMGSGFAYKGFSIGFNANYLFGSSTKLIVSEYPDVIGAFDIAQSTTSLTKGFLWDFGAQYYTQLGAKNMVLTLGATAKLAGDLTTENTDIWERGFFNEGNLTFENGGFASTSNSITGNISLPNQYGFGFMLTDTIANKWRFGADVLLSQWAEYKVDGITDPNLKNSVKISIGGSVTPNANDINNYWKRLNYRFGAYYNTNSLQLRETNLPEYGITFGMGMPLRFRNDLRQFARLNLSFDIGQRGSTNQNLISENYIKTTLGFTFNSKWFVKRRYY